MLQALLDPTSRSTIPYMLYILGLQVHRREKENCWIVPWTDSSYIRILWQTSGSDGNTSYPSGGQQSQLITDMIGQDNLQLPGCTWKGGKSPSKQNSNVMQILQHSENIMTKCSNLTFDLDYWHVYAHQENGIPYYLLNRPAQLSCIVYMHANWMIWGLDGNELPPQKVFPLKLLQC